MRLLDAPFVQAIHQLPRSSVGFAEGILVASAHINYIQVLRRRPTNLLGRRLRTLIEGDEEHTVDENWLRPRYIKDPIVGG
jgi:hypothetical protein